MARARSATMAARTRAARRAAGALPFSPAGFEAGLDFGQGEVRGDLASGVEDLPAGLVDVAGAADGIPEKIA
jgi:hypothetical protein